jgi:Family of unknown function (DUF6209)
MPSASATLEGLAGATLGAGGGPFGRSSHERRRAAEPATARTSRGRIALRYHVLDTVEKSASDSAMSYGLRLSFALVVAGLVGCAAPAAESTDDPSVSTSEAALGEAGTLTFGADYSVKVSGTLEKGKKVRVAYDPARLTACRGDFNGKPGWTITGYWSIGGGEVHSFEAGGFSPSNGTDQPVISLDRSGDLQLWFQNNSRWGCNAYDSDFGKNYHFAVQPAANEPGWLGNVKYVTSRQTCNGPCDGDLHDVQGEVLFDTWTRQRAAIKAIYFEAWKQGVTDFDNADLWRQLDVQVHSHVVGAPGGFATAYVGFDRRTGNNARYAVDLGALDPIKGQLAITNVADCPPFPLTAPASNGGQYVEAVVELYFTVNGVELRPAPGDAYRVRYQSYASAYAVCLH